jgi:hypothetical protein
VPWRHLGEWRYSSTIHNLGTRWRWAVFTPLPLYTRGRCPRYPLDTRPGKPQSWSGRCGEEETVPLPGIEPGPSSPDRVAIPTELFRLSCNSSWLFNSITWTASSYTLDNLISCYVCMYKGWAIKLTLAPRPLMIYCASPLPAAMIITVAALRIVLAHGSKPT